MTIQHIIAFAGCALVLLWVVLRYFKIGEGKYFNAIPLVGLFLLIASLFIE